MLCFESGAERVVICSPAVLRPCDDVYAGSQVCLETKVLRRDPPVLSDAVFGNVGADSVAHKSVRRNDVGSGVF